MKIQPRLLLPLLIFCSFATSAETIEIPIGQQSKEKWNVERPQKGMSKQQVENVFGAPLDATTAIGEPPISSWTYQDYVVYFEYDHVIHTVLKPTSESASLQQ